MATPESSSARARRLAEQGIRDAAAESGPQSARPGPVDAGAPPEAARVAAVLSRQLGGSWALEPLGCSGLCTTWRATPAKPAASPPMLFLKSLPVADGAVLQAESDGLAALAQAGCIRVPAVAGCWDQPSDGMTVLATTWLDFAREAPPGHGAAFGHQLAMLHARAPAEGSGMFGWRRDNWLGGTPQVNRWSSCSGRPGWIEFLAEQRFGALATRLAEARAAPALLDAIRRLIDALPRFFDDGHEPRPSLVHGDLWSGNWGCLRDGSPVIYDPAVSISDAEAELAMMELFGVPPAGFWPAYREQMPVAPGYARRRGLYQLYHLLNHALLFGGAYTRQSFDAVTVLLDPR